MRCSVLCLPQHHLYAAGKAKFVRRLDYLTNPGYLGGADERRLAGLPDGGPAAVVSTMGIFRFDLHSREMYLSGFYPELTAEQLLENMEFSVDVSRAAELPAPDGWELEILRTECDPQGLIL